jgi:RNA polymerase sigma-70 factor (ECF subfamily)
VAAPARSASPRSAPARFEELFRSRYRELYSLSYRLLGDAAEAEDVVQEVFWRLAGSDLLDLPDGDVTAWLRRVCINASYNRLRGQRRATRRLERAARLDPGELGDDTLDEVLRAERQQAVRRALAALPERQRACLLLRHSGYSYAEISAALEIATGSVGTLLARAERTFRHNFEEHEDALS